MPSVTTSKVKQDREPEPSILDAIPPDDVEYDYGPAGGLVEAVPDPTVHHHPRGIRQRENGVDSEGRRLFEIVQDRQNTYAAACAACAAEDEARMGMQFDEQRKMVVKLAAPTMTPQELSRTLWLVPDSQYDSQVVRAYLRLRYGKRIPEATINSRFHGERMSFIKGAQIVVVTRRGFEGAAPGPATRRLKDAEDKFTDVPVPPEEYIREVVESSPVVIAHCMTVTPSTMFSDASTDMSELVGRLAERAYPYRIAIPADTRDKFYSMTQSA